MMNTKDQFGETFNKYTKEDKENSPSKNYQDQPSLSMREKYIQEKNAKKQQEMEVSNYNRVST